MAQRVSGAVSYEIDLGCLKVVSLKTENPLYVRDRSQYERRFLARSAGLSHKKHAEHQFNKQ